MSQYARLLCRENKVIIKFSTIITRAIAFVLLVAVSWTLLEWLFFVTKPSFMGQFSLAEKFAALSGAALMVALVLLLVAIPFVLAGWILSRTAAFKRFWTVVALLPPALLASCAMLLVADNFSLTVIDYGIRDSIGVMVWVYRFAWLALLAWAWLIGERWLLGSYPRRVMRTALVSSLVLLSAALPLTLVMAVRNVNQVEIDTGGTQVRPNILILSGDGVASEHMSVYGYSRETTPFLDSIRDEFLIAENHFSNSADTGGSIISLMTGKLPTTTRVVYPPDVLQSRHSVQHLPGLLQQLGYYTADVSMRHYADPYDLNLREGFNEANFRILKADNVTPLGFIRQHAAFNHSTLLLERMIERVWQRFQHVWMNQAMPDPFAGVNEPDHRWISDKRRMVEFKWFLRRTSEPFFLHIHTMGTHGKRFKPTERHWSTDDDYPKLWHVGGYDDAMRDFDRMVEDIYKTLKKKQLLESTILIISSDHGFKHSPVQRLPFMMRVPGLAHTGTIAGNTQRLDIAPTLIELLGLPSQPWMEGRSLLSFQPETEPERLLFATGSILQKSNDLNFWSVTNPEAPWYSLGRLFLVRCDQGFTLHIASGELLEETIAGSSAACENRLNEEQAREILHGHLREQGYLVN